MQIIKEVESNFRTTITLKFGLGDDGKIYGQSPLWLKDEKRYSNNFCGQWKRLERVIAFPLFEEMKLIVDEFGSYMNFL